MTKVTRIKLTFRLLSVILIPAIEGSLAADDFEHPNSYIGNADWDRRLVHWVDVAEIPVDKDFSLPFRLRFKSGKGDPWWCPLLESEAGFPKEFYLKYSTVAGGSGYLTKQSGFVSDDGRIRGEIDGREIVLHTSKGDFTYQKEQLSRIRTSEGTVVEWVRDGKVTKLVKSDGTTLLSATRTDCSLDVRIGETRFSLKSQKDAKGDSSGWSISYPDGRLEEWSLAKGEATRLTVKTSDGSGADYQWRPETGELISDSDFSYEMRPTDTGKDLLHRVDAKGLSEWYCYDGDKGAATYKRQDGSRVVSWYDLRKGPTNMKVYRMDTISAQGNLLSSRLISYASSGEVEKEWTELGALEETTTQGIRFIDVDEAIKLHGSQGTIFIDARHPAAFRAGSIPGAVNIARVSFERNYTGKEDLLRAASILVVYCTSRNCEDSSIVATKLSALGYKNVVIFEGGWAEWWKRH